MDNKNKRLIKVASEFSVGINTIIEFLNKKGFHIDSNPNTKIPFELYEILVKEYSSDINLKKESEKLAFKKQKKENLNPDDNKEQELELDENSESEKVILIKDLSSKNIELKKEPKKELKVLGKIDLDALNKKKKVEEQIPENHDEIIVEEKENINQHLKEPYQKVIIEEFVDDAVDIEEVIDEDTIVSKIEIDNDIKTEKSESEIKVVGRINLDLLNQRTRPPKKTKQQIIDERKERDKQRKDAIIKERVEKEKERIKEQIRKEDEEKLQKSQKNNSEIFQTEKTIISGPTVVGKIELPEDKKALIDAERKKNKRKKRKRIKKELINVQDNTQKVQDPDKTKTIVKPKDKKLKIRKQKKVKKEVNEVDVQKQIKETLSRLTKKSKSTASKYRREKRDEIRSKIQEEAEKQELEKSILKVTEFISANELANMINVHVNQIIATCMDLGTPVSINQRLDAETISILANEFGYEVQFITEETPEENTVLEQELPENLKPRPPIVTVMGHVDHGKTSLLDYIRNTNVIAGEAGGITQHIGAYKVELEGGRKITFLDTPGHEAFTAMRARGAKITDIAIIVVAADDSVMPTTMEAINHALAAQVPIVFAINKIDKPNANPEKIKEDLAQRNFLVEDWGGKYGSVNISAKKGINVSELLERVLLEAEMLELKANPNRNALGTVLESALDKGRGYTTTILVKTGTLKVGDIILAGTCFGKVKAMFNERNNKVTEAGPSEPVMVLGLDGAAQAGEKFEVVDTEREAKDIVNKRRQIQREVGLRTQKHLTLEEIGRRIAIGGFKEINLIVKGDVAGSIEAISDALIKLSTQEIQINVIHKAVGGISESDVMLATASNAIIIGFQVRPSQAARKVAEKEQIDIRTYSIIYDAINDLKSAMEGMLSPEIREEIIGSAEVIETFHISKVGTIAGCMVKDGKILRSAKIRIIRDGIVVHTGDLSSLKRFKDDVKEVSKGFDCGLSVHNYDLQVHDIVEAFIEKEYRKSL